MEIDLSLNRSLEELESSYWEFVEATEGEDSSGWSSSVQEDIASFIKHWKTGGRMVITEHIDLV